MKNYVIALLITCIVVLGTFFYKLNSVPILNNFPIEQPVEYKPGDEPPLYIFILFSQHNCPVCLEAIQVLNELPPPFVVTGIVPVKELSNEKGLRVTTGAAFKLIGFKEYYRKFAPITTSPRFSVYREVDVFSSYYLVFQGKRIIYTIY